MAAFSYLMGSYKDGSYKDVSMVFSTVPEDKGKGATDYSLAGSGVLVEVSLG